MKKFWWGFFRKMYLAGLILAIVVFCTMVIGMLFGDRDWANADHSSAGLAPDPKAHHEAVVQVYAARTFNWRGAFAVHTWIATKEKGAADYTVYQVIGFNIWRGKSAVSITKDIPDRRWYNAQPWIIDDLRGEAAEQAIPYIRKAAEEYPYRKVYHAWPGPNSNTFISTLIRETPQLKVELPSLAIGKDWLKGNALWAKSESGTGIQLSLFGLLGMTVGVNEGLEVNILGLVFGVDLKNPALKLPMIGRLGMSDKG